MTGAPMQASGDFATKLGILKAIDRPVADMSVTEICEKAGISRTTFYRHFDSKLDIMPWWGVWCAEQYVFEIGRKYSWEEGMLRNLYLFRSQLVNLRVIGDFRQKTPYFGGNPYSLRHAEELRKTARMNGHEVTALMDACITAFCHLESELTYAYCKEGLKNSVLEDTQIILSLVPPIVYDACQLPAVSGESRGERFAAIGRIDKDLKSTEDLEKSFLEVLAHSLSVG